MASKGVKITVLSQEGREVDPERFVKKSCRGQWKGEEWWRVTGWTAKYEIKMRTVKQSVGTPLTVKY